MYEPAHQYPVDVWDRVIATNLRSVFLGSRAVIPYMLKARKGAIINTCSTFGSFVARTLPAYTAAKGGVLMLTKQMAVDYGPMIRVNAISPGTIDSAMMRSVIAASPDPAGREQEFIESNPVLLRIGDPREIAYGVLFLASDESSFVVGADLFMGGGQGLFASPIS
ncbi:SDR family NAD(P)-dependent oxidoreductase [Arthrobacter sp. SD76]|uniref:SDR family NAD(P)-dependent oxidoreductase n=1 Tax=Arthrobacter sp. SD76 TaxID=3415007 RepID=UPI003C781C93